MIYDHSNATGATVYEIGGSSEPLRMVMEIDTDRATVLCAFDPMRVDPADDSRIHCYEVRYRTIVPIFGGEPWPQLFHCYV